ncbi:DUF726-domain-containing protein [Dendrothele bispora CBS 962.96]|uniref:DUF726-domain-containing protein n=1 Tax=Dendrothele bispora (strain CBS 962.96) TaxID=1314807 RepID=A0A4S8LEQ3_DENBC|nr:DUF726-domain-containing protein [Dendrothele bispora CBS 962.96]
MSSPTSPTLAEVTPPAQLTKSDTRNVFEQLFRRLAAHRNTAELYALTEYNLSSLPEPKKAKRKEEFVRDLNKWAQDLLKTAWMVCGDAQEECPILDELADTSIGDLPPLPSAHDLSRLINTILFIHITENKQYSARTRTFLSTAFLVSGVYVALNEEAVVNVLKHPDQAIEEVQRQAQNTRESHANRGKTLRMVGMGVGAVLGGVLVGVTGGLAAPLVGATVTTVLGWLGVGGTAAGLLAGGLASSSAVCGALFGVYGAKTTADMVQRHTREIRDLAIVPVRTDENEETLGVRLCVSGWLKTPEDVTLPWTVFGGDDTFALQWEVKALQDLSTALYALITSHTMKYIRAEIIRRTVFASLMFALAPITLLKIGEIIDNPWMNTKALAVKAGAVLGDLLAKRAFGNRPITLTGYSLGGLVILEALKHLASLPPSETAHMIQDVYLFGCPGSTDPNIWTSIRRLVTGRIVNGYSNDDYVLAILSRASQASWKIAGLHPVEVQGVENILFSDVDGHLKWRGLVGKCLRDVGAPGVNEEYVETQLHDIALADKRELDMSTQEADEILAKGPDVADSPEEFSMPSSKHSS